MKAQLLTLSAAGLLLAAGAAHAASFEVQRYLHRAETQANAKLAEAGVAVGAHGATIRATVGADGRLNAVRVVRSSGSVETDVRTTQALRRLKIANPPVELAGREVNIALGQAIVQAKAP